VAIDTNLIHYRELYITGSTRSSISQYRKTLEMLTEGQLDLKSIITHRYPIDEALTAFQNAAASVGLKHILVFES
jgi:L-iditol 2-dehydrogenase